MKTETLGVITSIKNESGMSIDQGSFVSVNGGLFNSGEEFNLSLGIALADSNDGEMIPVAVTGIALAKSGGAIGRGNAIQCDGSTITQINFADPPTANELQAMVGKALDTATGADELIRVLLK